MIKDSIDFDYAYGQIQQQLKEDVFVQDEILKSESFNTTLSTMESNLNSLYENCRNLENMINYCKTFLSVKIDQYNKEMDAVLNIIEDVRDINKNMAYIDYPVNLIEQDRMYKDRDGLNLSMCKIQNGKVLLGQSHVKDVYFSNCLRNSSFVCYKENLVNLASEPYRVTYIEDSIHKGGMREQITVNFLSPVTINNINLKTSNCNVENIVYKYINGTKEYQDKYITGHTSTKMITAMTFDLVCTNYRHTTYKIDKNKMTDNTWDKLKTYEYNDLTSATTQIEVDELIEVIRDNDTTIINESESSDIVTINKYTYRFGLDYFTLHDVERYNESCFVSGEIQVGKMKDTEYLNINSDFISADSTDVEFYIIDGNQEIPILPLSKNEIKNEKIFTGLPLRFNTDDNNFVIRKNGYVINMDLKDALNQVSGEYSVDYIPNKEHCYSYTPINTSVKIKAVLRRYNDFAEMPYIKSIKIRKFGGAAPWIEGL
jgi:hypothetical protein